MTPFEEGFLTKCAEAGLTPEEALYLYKEAIFKGIAKGVGGFARGVAGKPMGWGRGAARRAGQLSDLSGQLGSAKRLRKLPRL